jgi:hypothetical protein
MVCQSDLAPQDYYDWVEAINPDVAATLRPVPRTWPQTRHIACCSRLCPVDPRFGHSCESFCSEGFPDSDSVSAMISMVGPPTSVPGRVFLRILSAIVPGTRRGLGGGFDASFRRSAGLACSTSRIGACARLATGSVVASRAAELAVLGRGRFRSL